MKLLIAAAIAGLICLCPAEKLLATEVEFACSDALCTKCLDSMGKEGLNKKYLGSCGDLRDLDLRYNDLRGIDLRGANLSGSDLTGANLLSAALSSARFSGAILNEANLEGVNGRWVAFDSASMVEVTTDLNFRTHLVECNFQGANLSGSNLARSRFTRSNFQGAIMQNVNLHGSVLYEAVFMDANLQNASIEWAQVQTPYTRPTKFDRAKLQGASFNFTNLRNTSFVGANMRYASVLSSNLEGADFRCADLQKITYGAHKQRPDRPTSFASSIFNDDSRLPFSRKTATEEHLMIYSPGRCVSNWP